MALQEGIYHEPGVRPGRFLSMLFLRAAPGSDAPMVGRALAGLWAMYQDLRRGMLRDLEGVVLPVQDDRMTVLLGWGPKAFDLAGIAKRRPSGLGPASRFRSAEPSGGGPLLRGSGLHYADDVRANPATEEFCVQVIADTRLACDRAVVETWKLLHDQVHEELGTAPLQLTTFYLGSSREDRRSWIDFHDGLSNLTSAERDDVIRVKPGTDVEWAVGGSYLTFLRLAVDLPRWRGIDRTQQELAVGRDKLTGCPLVSRDTAGRPRTEPTCPVAGTEIWESANDAAFAEPPPVADSILRASHVQRANHHMNPPGDPGTRRIFRQGYEFLEWASGTPGFRAGLNFISFQDDPQRVLEMLTVGGWLGGANFGGDETTNGLATLLTLYAAGVYCVPPRRDSEAFPGQLALGPL